MPPVYATQYLDNEVLNRDSVELVCLLYAKAIELGGTDEGAPGARSENFYAGYFRDLDGNKANFFCMT